MRVLKLPKNAFKIKGWPRDKLPWRGVDMTFPTPSFTSSPKRQEENLGGNLGGSGGLGIKDQGNLPFHPLFANPIVPLLRPIQFNTGGGKVHPLEGILPTGASTETTTRPNKRGV